MNNHTPGPWRRIGYGVYSAFAPERRIALVEWEDGYGVYKVADEKECIANAALISVVPEMYEALTEFCRAYENGEDSGAKAYAMAKRVFAKAEGRK